jgi:hypothetical protein
LRLQIQMYIMETDPKLDKIIDMLTNIEGRLDRMEENIKDIREKSQIVEKDCSKMREHIVFIESTYSAVRTPLSYIKQHVEYMMGKTTKDLPAIECQDEYQDEK